MRLANLTWPKAQEYFEKNDMVLISIGSIECHGRHMPLGTDTLIPDFLLEKIEQKSDVLIAPTIPYGACQSLAPYPGTIDIDNEVLYQFCRQIFLSLYRHGARKFVFLNGHGGNMKMIERLGLEFEDKGCLVAMLNWWLMAWDMNPAWKGGHGGGEEDQHEEVYFERHAGQGRNGPCDEQQRVAGQERGDDQPGFAEDDEEQDGVCPQVVVLDDTDEVLIDMQNEIQQKLHKLLCVLKVMERISLRPERGGGDGRVRMAALNAHAFQHVDIITVGIPETGGFADAGRGAVPGKGSACDAAHSGCRKGCRRPEIRGEASPERKERGRGVGPGVFRKGTIGPVCGGGVFRPVDHGVRAAGRGNGRTFAGGESGQQKESQQQGEQSWYRSE